MQRDFFHNVFSPTKYHAQRNTHFCSPHSASVVCFSQRHLFSISPLVSHITSTSLFSLSELNICHLLPLQVYVCTVSSSVRLHSEYMQCHEENSDFTVPTVIVDECGCTSEVCEF